MRKSSRGQQRVPEYSLKHYGCNDNKFNYNQQQYTHVSFFSRYTNIILCAVFEQLNARIRNVPRVGYAWIIIAHVEKKKFDYLFRSTSADCDSISIIDIVSRLRISHPIIF